MFFNSLLRLSALGAGDTNIRGVTYAEFSPDGTCVMFALGDGTIRIWDIKNERIVRQFPAHSKGVYKASYSPDGKYILSSGADFFLRVWNPDGTVVFTVPPSNNGLQLPVATPSFNASGDRIVTLSGLTIRMLDTRDWEELWNVQIPPFIYLAAFNPDGTRIAVGDGNGNYVIHILDSGTGTLIRSFEKAHSDLVTSISFSRDGKYILTAADSTFCLWDSESGELVYQIYADGFATFVQFCPDGMSFIGIASDEVYIRDVKTGRLISRMESNEYNVPSDVRSAVFSRDGKRIVTAGANGDVCIWNAGNGELLDELIPYLDYTEYEFTEEDIARLYSEFLDLFQ
jgi:WD40 repeat protein